MEPQHERAGEGGAPPEPASSPGSRAAGEDGGLFQLATELGPLVLFFVANWRFDIFVATGVFMVAIVAALAAAWQRQRRLPVMPLVTAVFVLVFGGLTLWLQDELFIKLKPTIVNLLFAAILLVGLSRGRIVLALVLGQALRLDPLGWRRLTVRWALFFVFLAALNEVVHRTCSTDFWVGFKSFGMLPLTILFTLSQMPLLARHALEEEAGPR